MDDMDPTISNPEFYRTLWENDDVRVLEYLDAPGDETTAHRHPNSVMITLTDFDRQLSIGGTTRDVTLAAGAAVWLPTQTHSGRNTGTTATHTILVELKHSTGTAEPGVLGPAT